MKGHFIMDEKKLSNILKDEDDFYTIEDFVDEATYGK